MNSAMRSVIGRSLQLLLLAGLTLAWLGLADPTSAQTPKRGGILRVAVLGDPPTLDSHWTTANFVEVITQHIYEGLYTLDQSYQPYRTWPMGCPPCPPTALPTRSSSGRASRFTTARR